MKKEKTMKWKNRIIETGIANPAELIANPINFRKHPKRQQEAINGSLDALGWIQNVIVNKRTGRIIDGHLRVDQAIVHGEMAVPVQWVDLSEEEEGQALLSLDPIAAMAETNRQTMTDILKQINDTQDALAPYLEDIAKSNSIDVGDILGKEEDDPPDENEAESFLAKWGVESGQLWELGEHRVLCGDCTDKNHVKRIIFGNKVDILLTDPPYNVGIQYGSGVNDSKTVEQNESFIKKWFQNFSTIPLKVITPGAGYYLGTLRSWLTLFPPTWMCIWVRKNSLSHSPLRGFQVWEPMLYYSNEENDIETDWSSALIYGKVKKPIKQDVFTIPVGIQKDVADKNGNKLHPTPKPQELFRVLLRMFTEEDQTIMEPFLGSGTTLIACENLRRKCRGIEISPEYVAVTIERWHRLTGKQPRLLGSV